MGIIVPLDHISHSQYSTYVKCPRSWYLGKLQQAEERQTWFLPIGTAVHQMIDHHLTDRDPATPCAEDFFYPLIAEQMKIDTDTSQWLAGGSKDEPVIEGRAIQRVKDCFEKALEVLDSVNVWEVEYDATGRLPGCEVPVKGFVDIIGEHKKHGPVILDWKTGSQKPKDNFQLETYAALLKGNSRFKHDGFWGLWAMLKPGAPQARPVDLQDVDSSDIGSKYQEVYDRMKSQIYATDPSRFKCDWCFQSLNCRLMAGDTDRAIYYDRADQDGFPF